MNYYFFITNCWSSNQSNAKLYCFYNIESLKEKLLEPGFIQSITFGGTLILNTDQDVNTIDKSFDIFEKKPYATRANTDYPEQLFEITKYKNPFFHYNLLGWNLTNGEITQNMNRYSYNSFYRALYEFFYNLDKNGSVFDYRTWNKDQDLIIEWQNVLKQVENR